MNKQVQCPVCSSNSLTLGTFTHTLMVEDKTLQVDGLEHYLCADCGADPAFPDQIRRNELKITDARKHLQGLLTSAEIRAVRLGLGLSQSEAAALFGGGANAFSKYERGNVVQSMPMDRLLRLAQAIPVVVTILRQNFATPCIIPTVPASGAFIWPHYDVDLHSHISGRLSVFGHPTIVPSNFPSFSRDSSEQTADHLRGADAALVQMQPLNLLPA